MTRRWRLVCHGTLLVLLVALAIGATRGWSLLRRQYGLYTVRSLERSGDFERALRELQSLADQMPANGKVAYLLSSAYRRNGKLTDARESLARARQLGWSRREIQRQELLIQFQSGDIDRSEPALMQILADGCSDAVAAEIYDCLVKGYLADLRLDYAGVTLDFWVEWQPKAIEPRVLRAQLFKAVRDEARERQEYENIIALDPGNRDARAALGLMLMEIQDLEGALEQFQTAYEMSPDDATMLIPLAACRRRAGRSSEAKTMLLQALAGELEAGHRAYALAELAQILMEEKDLQHADDASREAVELAPGDRTVHYIRGLVLSRLGKAQDAESELSASRRLDALEVRKQEVTSGVIHSPLDADLRCEAGEIELEIGNRHDALLWFLSSLRCNKWHERTHEALARYYADEGDQAMAKKHLAWAVESRVQAPHAPLLTPLPASPAPLPSSADAAAH